MDDLKRVAKLTDNTYAVGSLARGARRCHLVPQESVKSLGPVQVADSRVRLGPSCLDENSDEYGDSTFLEIATRDPRAPAQCAPADTNGDLINYSYAELFAAQEKSVSVAADLCCLCHSKHTGWPNGQVHPHDSDRDARFESSIPYIGFKT
jgi:hypothetical protein